MIKNYPKPTKSLTKAKNDLKIWGYCLLEEAIPKELNNLSMNRLIEQAQAEKKLNLAYEDGSKSKKWGEFENNSHTKGINQRVWMLPNKGKVFLDILQNHAYINCIKNIVGDQFLVSSFSANIARPGGIAMDLHTDQWWLPDPVKRKADFLPAGSINRKFFDLKINTSIIKNNDLISRPAVSNVLIMLNGMSKKNGGTLIVPGSHLFGRHPDKIIDCDIKTISAEGPPGCAIITDGRLWHGTGANISNEDRLAILITFCAPQFRPQENFAVGIKQDIYPKLTDFQKELFGFKIWNGYGRTGNPTEIFIDINNNEIGELKI
ncbi:phytanoyl-CoA dioxygenase family protein [Alphaproteobacteria bacterium]|nr:phytanoyl-CoA dioxygenase family protein [Alphaproteobacteria bacterium]MDB9915355.1 phytanoyl-CoA dioxygenase family protein [Alphaproteobacteria bacterium]